MCTFMLGSVCLVLTINIGVGLDLRPFIEPELLQSTNTVKPESVDILLTMRSGTAEVLAHVSTKSFRTSGDRRAAVYQALKDHAHNSQGPLLDALNSSPLLLLANGSNQSAPRVTSYWITNKIHIANISMSILDLLTERHDIARIEKQGTVHLAEQGCMRVLDRVGDQDSRKDSPITSNWNIERIRAPEAWALGINGTGVVVGSINAGVHPTHELLRSNYKNDNYSWYDPVSNSSVPFDEYRYGTPNMGLMVGNGGFGVAPGAKWITCKAYTANDIGDITNIFSCAQFMLCPTWPDGSNPDCSQAPRVVHNPWFGFPEDWHFDMLNAWHMAGIISVWGAAYNTSKGCGTIQFPGSHELAIAVGATDNQERIYDLSARGPAQYGQEVKPDISATGVNVNSSNKDSDDSYACMSGTSVSSAHVVGIVALLLSENSSLGLQQIKRILQVTAERGVGFNCSECDGRYDSIFPNYHFGYGRVDAFAALECVRDGNSCLNRWSTMVASDSWLDAPPIADFSDDCASKKVFQLWLVLGLAFGGTLALISTMIGFWRVRAAKQQAEYASNAILQIIRQFRNGEWPHDDASSSHDDDQEGAGISSNSSDQMSASCVALATPYDLERYEIPAEHLEIDESRMLGNGEFGMVFSGILRHRQQQNGSHYADGHVAVKKLKETIDVHCVASFLKELKIMISVGEHPNIIQLFGACTENVQNLCIVLEYCTNGNLKAYLRAHRGMFQSGSTKLSSRTYIHAVVANGNSVQMLALTPVDRSDLLRWTIEIATGMEFLEYKKIIHGDLACRNVLLNENRVVKISDFGLASKLYEYKKYTKAEQEQLLPWRWMAPESLQDMRFSHASDVWAFGITAWEVFTLAKVPYPGSVWSELFLKHLLAGSRNSRPTYASEELYEVMNACWALEHGDRPTMKWVKEKLVYISRNEDNSFL